MSGAVKKAVCAILAAIIPTCVFAAFTIFQVAVTLTPPAVICDITTGLATGTGSGTCLASPATCNGIVSDSQKFADFNTWAVSWQATHSGLIELYIPPGKTCYISGDEGADFAKGVRQLLVSGYGATLKATSTTVHFGGDGVCAKGIAESDGCSARTAQANSGSTSVTLLDGSLNSRFTVGRYAIMAGFDMQGQGYPFNPFYFDFVKITGISGTTISFDRALTHTYLTTWPLINAGTSGQVDMGGPATLYALPANWNTEVEYRGITLDYQSNYAYSVGRQAVWRDVTFLGNFGPVPTENESWSEINSTCAACLMETDKLVKLITISGSTHLQINVQSAGSYDTMVVSNTTINSMQGTPRVFTGNRVTIADLRLGPSLYGRADDITCTSCVIASVSALGNSSEAVSNYSMSGGVITVPLSAALAGLVGWNVPGTNNFWRGSYFAETAFQVTGVTQSGNNMLVQTSLVGGFPAVPGATVKIQTHPAPKLTCTNCTGAAGTVMSTWPAAAPLFSYHVATYTGAATSFGQFTQWGKLSSLSINVTNAYGGAGGLDFHLSQFDNWNVLKSDYSATTYGPVLNAKTAGNRVITLSGVTGTQSGDSGLAMPDATSTWFPDGGNSGPTFSADVSASCPGASCPSITLTFQTDQGVVNP